MGAVRSRPLCLCGCGERVTKPSNRYIQGHMPPWVRTKGAKRSGQTRAFMARRRIFAKAWELLQAGDRTVTKERLFAAFHVVHTQSYLMGYTASECKWRKRQGGQVAA